MPPESFFALFLPGVFFVSAPVMWRRFAAVLVFEALVARFTEGGALFLAALFFDALFFAGAFFAVAFFDALFFALDFFVADFFAVAIFT